MKSRKAQPQADATFVLLSSPIHLSLYVFEQVALDSPILLESELNAIINDKGLGSQLFK